MRNLKKVSCVILLVASVGSFSAALGQQNAQERVTDLQLQLAETQAKQDELQARLKELDELLKPENIASALAGVGSVHPEVLREERRRQLASEKASVSLELNQLSATRVRIETALRKAEADAYHQSAAPVPSNTGSKGPSVTASDSANRPVRPVVHRRSHQNKRHKAKRKKVTAPSTQ